jgi:hypothetical protein
LDWEIEKYNSVVPNFSRFMEFLPTLEIIELIEVNSTILVLKTMVDMLA